MAGKFGVRIEDVVVMGEKGAARLNRTGPAMVVI